MTVTTDLRDQVAAVLDLVNPDWPAQRGPVDAAQPPCYVVEWFAEWLTPATACSQWCAFDVVAIGGRLDPAENLDELERQVEGAYAALYALDLTPNPTDKPFALDLGGVNYLAARLHVRALVTIPTELAPDPQTGTPEVSHA